MHEDMLFIGHRIAGLFGSVGLLASAALALVVVGVGLVVFRGDGGPRR